MPNTTPAAGAAAPMDMSHLLEVVKRMLANSTAPEAAGCDPVEWLDRWMQTPQPALGGKKPREFIDTPGGGAVVARVLGAIESGAYQ